MRDPIVARKYALALFNAARNLGQLDEVAGDLTSLAEYSAAKPQMMRYLVSPQVPLSAKRELLDRAFKGRASDLTLRFLHLVLDKKRIEQLPGVFEKFHGLVRAHRGIARAEVRTAVPLEAGQSDRLRKSLGQLTGKTVEIESRMDPDILGGVVVAFDSQIIDRSVRRGLDDLRDTLMKVRVL